VIRAIDAVVVKATTDEMTSSNAKVLVADVRHVTSAEVTDVTFAKTANATTAKATHVSSAKATHVATAKAAHVASATTTVSSAAAGLCTGGKQAAGKHRACQNHHHSSSHDFLHWDGRTLRHRAVSELVCLSKPNTDVGVGVSQQAKHRRRDGADMGMLICCHY
jgi:hypothetical protein